MEGRRIDKAHDSAPSPILITRHGWTAIVENQDGR
jgi:hypothetical protein